MRGYLATAIAQAQRPMSGVVTARRLTMRPAATPAAPETPNANPGPAPLVAHRTEPDLQSRTPTAPPAVHVTVPAIPAAQSAPPPGPGPIVRVTAIPDPAKQQTSPPSQASPQEKPAALKPLARDTERPVESPQQQQRAADKRDLVEEVFVEYPQASPPPARETRDATNLPLHVEWPREAAYVPPATRARAEREVTRVVRERVRRQEAVKSADVPGRIEVRVDRIEVRMETPVQPAPAPMAPAPQGFGDYALARVFSR